MIVGLDATFLLYFFAPDGQAGAPLDSAGVPVTMPRERVAGLIDELGKAGATIIVATPALSEIMVRSGVQAGQAWATIMRRSRIFQIVPFDEKSAIEVALMAGHEVKGQKRNTSGEETYAKLKYDRQIVAISKTEGASVFYTDDGRQTNLAQRCGMTVRGLADCPLPTLAAQTPLRLEGGHGEGLTQA